MIVETKKAPSNFQIYIRPFPTVVTKNFYDFVCPKIKRTLIRKT
jgi:hypothetical protein